MSGGITLVAGVTSVLPWGGTVVSLFSVPIPAVAVSGPLSVSVPVAVSVAISVAISVAVAVPVTVTIAVVVTIPSTVTIVVVVRSSRFPVAWCYYFYLYICRSSYLK